MLSTTLSYRQAYRLRNMLRISWRRIQVGRWHIPVLDWPWLRGWLGEASSKIYSRLSGVATMTGALSAVHIFANGERVDLGVLGRFSVTDAGVAYMVDDWDDDTTDITILNFHACGTTNTAENVTDTALAAEATTITDRIAGTKSQPAANQIRSVGTQSFTGAGAIVEHGLFHIITESTGTLWDRTVFLVINVVNLDSIEWTYTLTITAGG